MYYVDGNSRERVNGFLCWRVIDEAGTVLCTFFGPYSKSAANSFCKALREDKVPDVIVCDYDNINGIPVNDFGRNSPNK